MDVKDVSYKSGHIWQDCSFGVGALLKYSHIFKKNNLVNSFSDANFFISSFAPWCPACRAMVDTWIEFGKWGNDLNLDGVGEIDVTQSPGLSGRFLITSLPTILQLVQ